MFMIKTIFHNLIMTFPVYLFSLPTLFVYWRERFEIREAFLSTRFEIWAAVNFRHSEQGVPKFLMTSTWDQSIVVYQALLGTGYPFLYHFRIQNVVENQRGSLALEKNLSKRTRSLEVTFDNRLIEKTIFVHQWSASLYWLFLNSHRRLVRWRPLIRHWTQLKFSFLTFQYLRLDLK